MDPPEREAKGRRAQPDPAALGKVGKPYELVFQRRANALGHRGVFNVPALIADQLRHPLQRVVEAGQAAHFRHGHRHLVHVGEEMGEAAKVRWQRGQASLDQIDQRAAVGQRLRGLQRRQKPGRQPQPRQRGIGLGLKIGPGGPVQVRGQGDGHAQHPVLGDLNVFVAEIAQPHGPQWVAGQPQTAQHAGNVVELGLGQRHAVPLPRFRAGAASTRPGCRACAGYRAGSAGSGSSRL